jgi:hypothetical protein
MASRTSVTRTDHRRAQSSLNMVNRMAELGEDDGSDIDITNVVERELRTDAYIRGK